VKTKYLTPIILVLGMLALLTSACSGGNSAPTAAPTTAPTVAPTLPPAAASTATQTPAAPATQNAAPSAGGEGSAVIAALGKFQNATSFRLDAQAHLSALFFGAPYTPAPGEDPKQVTIFSVKGEVQAPDSHITLGGFLGSFLALVTGFDPNSSSVEFSSVSGKKYVRGALPGSSDTKWYVLSDAQAASTSFDPKGSTLPIATVQYQVGDIAKTGTESLDNLACDVYTANRNAFDSAFPAWSSGAVFNPDKIDLSAVDNYEFKFWVCGDGNLHQVRYAFDGHDKTQPDQKGTFEFVEHISDYDTAISIQTPPDAAPLPAETTAAETPIATVETQAGDTPTAAAQETAPASAGYDGEWAGDETADNSFSFTVDGNQISDVSLNYLVQSGSCSLSGSIGQPVENAPIAGNSFTVQVSNSDGVEFTITGSFSSNSEASGTIQAKGTSQTCGAVDTQATWKSTKSGAPANGESATAVPTAASEPTSTDSLGVVNAFFAAANAKNYDAALALVNDQVVFEIGTNSGLGKAQLKTALEKGVTYTTSNIDVTGDVVDLAVKGSDGTSYANCSIILDQGKIDILTLQ
jgi:hypothetical protein